MASMVPSMYTHTQSTASTEWVILHNLGGSGGHGIPIIDVLVSENGNMVKMMPEDITIVDQYTATLTFSSPQSGVAIVIV